MTNRSTEHDTFVIERHYEAAPAKVFSLWSSPEAKNRWFGVPGDPSYRLDFVIGGEEHLHGAPGNGPVHSYDAVFRDIVPDERIVYHYTMDMDRDRISVSVVSVTFAALGGGTQLTYTEQGVFLDGFDTSDIRRKGTEELIDKLGGLL